MSVLLASELVQERLGKDVPRTAAFAPFYPVCSGMARNLANPRYPFYNAHTRMSAAPLLIHAGTRDDYEQGERPCDSFVASWPPADSERAPVRYFEGATHGFDSQSGSAQFFDAFARGRRAQGRRRLFRSTSADQPLNWGRFTVRANRPLAAAVKASTMRL
jgi:dienelactone hydrolase